MAKDKGDNNEKSTAKDTPLRESINTQKPEKIEKSIRDTHPAPPPPKDKK